MYAIIAAAVIAQVTQVDLFGTPSVDTVDLFGTTATQEFEHETAEDFDPDDPRVVILYSDHSCTECLSALRSESAGLSGFTVVHRDVSSASPSLNCDDLPLILYRARNGRWMSRAGWYGVDEFVSLWYGTSQSSGSTGRSPPAESRPPRGSSGDGGKQVVVGYRGTSGRSWHIVGGESRNSLINHLSIPHAEHHGLSLPRSKLQQLSFGDLVEAHSDLHNGRKGQFIYAANASGTRSTTAAATVAARPAVKYQSSCPSGNCPYARRR